MYKEHPELVRPADDTALWRYMNFTKFVSLLETSALYFSSIDQLGDPFEGSLSPNTPPQVTLSETGPSQRFQIDMRTATGLICVNCWHISEVESAAMWKLHSREHDGIAVRTNFSDLSSAFSCEQAISIGTVQYIDYETTLVPYGNALLPLFHKRLSFKHEQELRAAAFKTPSDEHNSNEKGIYCEVDLPTLIGEVVVAPYSDGWFFELVQSLADRHGLAQKVRRSALSASPRFNADLIVVGQNKVDSDS